MRACKLYNSLACSLPFHSRFHKGIVCALREHSPLPLKVRFFLRVPRLRVLRFHVFFWLYVLCLWCLLNLQLGVITRSQVHLLKIRSLVFRQRMIWFGCLKDWRCWLSIDWCLRHRMKVIVCCALRWWGGVRFVVSVDVEARSDILQGGGLGYRMVFRLRLCK